MELREIVSDACFIGWPTVRACHANRQTAYVFVGRGEQVSAREDDRGWTFVKVGDVCGERQFSPGLEPVVIRRSY